MTKQFKVIETNLESVPDTHFICETRIGTSTEVFDKVFRTVMFDGIKIRIIKEEKYVVGEVHGLQPT